MLLASDLHHLLDAKRGIINRKIFVDRDIYEGERGASRDGVNHPSSLNAPKT